MEPRPEAIGGIERTVFNTLLDVVGRAHFEVFSYRGRTLVFRLIEEGQRLQKRDIGGVAWLEEAAAAFTCILTEAGFSVLVRRTYSRCPVEEMKSDMRRNEVDLANLAIDELGIYASPDSALKLSTLHNAKGREYEAVAMIDLHEGRIPFWAARSVAEIDEAKRLFYVGVTRAQRLLLYVTDNSGSRDGPTRYLKMAQALAFAEGHTRLCRTRLYSAV